jgi:hypothetical protein
MSVASTLGIDDADGSALRAARERWGAWAAKEPALAHVPGLLDLRTWTRSADAAAKDDALRSLAKLGSATGDDDDAAITALVWALVPGASSLAFKLSDLADEIDQLVAAQLWIAAKTFEWERRRSTAASILRDTLRGVQADLGVGEGARRQDRVWTQTRCAEPSAMPWQRDEAETDSDAAADLLDLLAAATDARVITWNDRELLIDLAVASDGASGLGRRGRAGLMAPPASEMVAAKWGVSSRTVRRRAANSIDRLKIFAMTWLEESQADLEGLGGLPVSA